MTDLGAMMDAIRLMAPEDQTAADAAHRMYTTEMKTPWIPYPPEIVSDWTGWIVKAVRKQFGDTVLVRHGVSGVEFRRGVPDPAHVLDEVTAIIAAGRHTQQRAGETPSQAMNRLTEGVDL